jgi:hypothetical protein
MSKNSFRTTTISDVNLFYIPEYSSLLSDLLIREQSTMLIQMAVKPERCCAIPHLRQNLQEEEKMLDSLELMHLLCCKTIATD